MRPIVKQLFDQIDDILFTGGQDATDVWSIISALRGPDSQNGDLKSHYTCELRGHVFPRTTESWYYREMLFKPAWPGKFFPAAHPARAGLLRHVKQTMWSVESHFIEHFNEAVDAFRRE